MKSIDITGKVFGRWTVLEKDKEKRNSSGRIGVHWRKDQEKWRVSIKVQGITYNFGSYKNFEKACEICTEKELLLLGYSRENY